MWLGGLFIPEAYITATRQYVAQANSWSLEELYLQVPKFFLCKCLFDKVQGGGATPIYSVLRSRKHFPYCIIT